MNHPRKSKLPNDKITMPETDSKYYSCHPQDERITGHGVRQNSEDPEKFYTVGHIVVTIK